MSYRVQLLRVEAGRQRGETHAVSEKDGDELALALQRAAGGEDLLGEMSRRVPGDLSGRLVGNLRRGGGGARVRARGAPGARVTIPRGRRVQWRFSRSRVSVTPCSARRPLRFP